MKNYLCLKNIDNIHAVTYGQLVDTASRKLFRLRERLKEHYDAIGQESIVEKALKESVQTKMDLAENA